MTFSEEETVYFWKPEEEDGYLGQWYPSPFETRNEDGSVSSYKNAEQYMMHRKGLLFAPDAPVTSRINDPEITPKTIKALGRQIPNFSQDIWEKERYPIVLQANYLKFTQNEDLKKLLLATGDKQLVEASALDRIWGIGYSKKNAAAKKDNWGLNLLGKALMDTRTRIREEERTAAAATSE